MAWVEAFKQVFKPDPQDQDRLRDEYMKLSIELGAKPGVQLSEEQFLKGSAAFVALKRNRESQDN